MSRLKSRKWMLMLVLVALVAAGVGYGIGNYCAAQERKQLQNHLENEFAPCFEDLYAAVEDYLGHVDEILENEDLIAERFGSVSAFTSQTISVLDSVQSSLVRLDSYCRVLKVDNVSDFGYLPISVLSQLHDRLIQKSQGERPYTELYSDLIAVRLLLSELKGAMDAAQEQSQDPVETNFLFLKDLYQNQAVYETMLH